MRVIKKYLYPIGFAMMLFSSSAMAKLHLTNFNDITSFFKKGKEFYSPTLGEVALEVGFIENIRLNGSFKAAYKENGERQYIADSSSDPLWNVVKILFPSVNGQLGTVTDGNTNFGRYVTNAETVALLLNYAKDVRQGVDIKVDQVATKILSTLEVSGKNNSEISKRKSGLKTTTIKPLLQFIQKSIEEEGKDSLYPAYTTEQAISAFFAYQFNKQEEIWSLVKNLDDTIVDKEKQLPTQESLLKEEDIARMQGKETPYTIDDVFGLLQANSWQNLTPYKPGINLLNNGHSLFFDRKAGRDTGATFADCVETAGRHIFNLLLYDHINRKFNLDPLRRFVNEYSPGNLYFKNVENFYAVQTPLLANGGDVGTRSLNNQIVADLNAFEEGIIIGYLKDTNELRPGFINFIKVYQKVLGLPLKELPNDIETREEWVKASLSIFFSALNPTYTYDISLNLSGTDEELTGNAEITIISSETDEKLFSFNLMSSKGHMEINQLKILRKGKEIDYTSDLRDHSNTLHTKTAEESLWLLGPPALQDKIVHPLYKLFSRPLSDNDSRIDFLKMLKENYGRWSELQNNPESVQLMIKNVLEAISWDDEEIVKRISPVILSMIESPEFQEPSMFEDVRALNLAYSGIASCSGLENLLNLEELDLKYTPNLTQISFPQRLEKLKIFDVSQSGLSTLTGLDNISNVEEINLKNTRLTQLSFTQKFENLKKIDISESDISTLTGIDNIPDVEEIDLHNTGLTQLSFTQKFENLKRLDISGSDISTFRGLKNLPNLKELILRSTKLPEVEIEIPFENILNLSLANSDIKEIKKLENLQKLEVLDLIGTINITKISLEKPLNQLKILKLGESGIQELTHVAEYFPNLEEIYLNQTTNLSLLKFTKHMPNLKIIDLEDSDIKKIKGLKNLENLESLKLHGAALPKLVFKKSHEAIKSLDLENSFIETLAGLEHLSNLKDINLSFTKKLNKIAFEKPLEELEKLELKGSNVSEISGLENLHKVKRLLLAHTSNLSKLNFTQPLGNLEMVILGNSGISEITGLDNLENLKRLSLENAKNIKKLKVGEKNKDLTLNLKGSGIKSSKDIEGFEYLNPSKVFF